MGWDYWYAVQRTAFDTGWGRGSYDYEKAVKMTNFEWMTQDEQMVAIWLSEIGCDTCPAWTYCNERNKIVDETCSETLYNWLKCDFEREQIGAEIYKI